jgi:serine/threonine-protein kinase HipA
MKQCLCCGNSIESSSYHEQCLKALFNTNYLPKINFTMAELSLNAQKMAGKLSISGVQPKLSMKLQPATKELTVVSTGGEYILKPQLQIYPNIPQNENLCMSIAEKLGIDVPPHALIELKDGSIAYIIKRFDRNKSEKIHQEDFMQILGKQDKYRGSYEEIGDKILTISDAPGLDVQLFYERVLFNFIIGNGDAHFKNYSVVYGSSGAVRLAPAYDIVSSKLVIPEEEDSALTINGKKNKITGADFNSLRKYLAIPPKAVDGKYLDQADTIIETIKQSGLTEQEKEKLEAIVKSRMKKLSVVGS